MKSFYSILLVSVLFFSIPFLCVEAKDNEHKGSLTKITFIHYKKGAIKNILNPAGKPKPPACYGCLASGAKWKTESVQIKKETAVSGNENIKLSIQLPSDWTLKTVSKASNPNNIIKNCADYVLTNADSTAKLTVSPICTGWSAEYSDWPQSAVIIKEEKNVGNDGHTAYTVRYLDTATSQYKYVEGEKGTSNKIMDAILITYNASTGNFLPIRIMLDYSGINSEAILGITDKIVTSLKAQ